MPDNQDLQLDQPIHVVDPDVSPLAEFLLWSSTIPKYQTDPEFVHKEDELTRERWYHRYWWQVKLWLWNWLYKDFGDKDA